MGASNSNPPNYLAGKERKEMKPNKGLQATTHKFALCDGLCPLRSCIVWPVGRRLNADVLRENMKMAITTTLLALLLTGCVCHDQYRPKQNLSVKVNGEQSCNYTLFLADHGKRIQFQQTNGVHTVELPGTTYGTRYEFFLPVTSYPEKRELVIFTKYGSDVDGMSVQNIRNVVRTADGIYQIRLR